MISIFRVHLRVLSAEDEVVPLWPKGNSHFATQQDERENVAILVDIQMRVEECSNKV